PFIRYSIGAIYLVDGHDVSPVRTYVFPHDLMFAGHFQELAGSALGNQGVPVGQTLRAAYEWAVKPVVIDWKDPAEFLRSELPHYFHGDGIKLKHAGIVPGGVFLPCGTGRIGTPVPGPATVVEKH